MKRLTDIVLPMLLLIGMGGCAASGPTVQDVQVTNAALKAETIQAQWLVAELHLQLQALTKELGAARASHARLEGEMRERARQLAEAERLVDLQRDELRRAREEREGVAQTSRATQEQLVELGRLRERVADAERQQTRVQALEAAVERQTQMVAELRTAVVRVPRPGGPRPKGVMLAVASSAPVITVRPGDTLSELALTYGVGVTALKAANGLSTDLILPGQALVLPGTARK